MLDLFQIGAIDACGGLLPIVRVIKKGLFPIIQIGIPIVLILLGTIDLGKAVISSDDKQVKEAQGRLIKRFVYAALVFFVATLVSVLMNIVAQGGQRDANTTGWEGCWNAAG
ncbi:MAG: hypothetical protein IJG68_01100 [Bacilli bacterium]|nr:hypothetical protein [Bacilli bacterium]